MKLNPILIGTMLLIFSSTASYSQFNANAIKTKASKKFDNVHVEKLFGDKHSSSFVIWVKDEVKLHKHEKHSEHVYVLKGKAEMRVGEQVFIIKKGDMIFIPENTPHSVKVTGGLLKVISVQAPQYSGKDRVIIE